MNKQPLPPDRARLQLLGKALCQALDERCKAWREGQPVNITSKQKSNEHTITYQGRHGQR